ncbi:unnamed protein product [Toxocara canis]|uniref:Uncharacterized protein n=1 Tax=Toxocara canis TaxID=6265 RepID=A0A183U2Z0_TOXCA|nr:unnamed protein product [Toxocara canis]
MSEESVPSAAYQASLTADGEETTEAVPEGVETIGTRLFLSFADALTQRFGLDHTQFPPLLRVAPQLFGRDLATLSLLIKGFLMASSIFNDSYSGNFHPASHLPAESLLGRVPLQQQFRGPSLAYDFPGFVFGQDHSDL